METLQREVGECYNADESKAIARLDRDALVDLDLTPGDSVRISGESETVARVWRSDREDWHDGKILIDRFVRYNAQAEIGDTVTIEKVTLNSIDQITLLPVQGENIVFGADAIEMLKRQHLERPVQVGTVLPVATSRFDDPFPIVFTGDHTTEPGIITESTTAEIPESYLSTESE